MRDGRPERGPGPRPGAVMSRPGARLRYARVPVAADAVSPAAGARLRDRTRHRARRPHGSRVRYGGGAPAARWPERSDEPRPSDRRSRCHRGRDARRGIGGAARPGARRAGPDRARRARFRSSCGRRADRPGGGRHRPGGRDPPRCSSSARRNESLSFSVSWTPACPRSSRAGGPSGALRRQTISGSRRHGRTRTS